MPEREAVQVAQVNIARITGTGTLTFNGSAENLTGLIRVGNVKVYQVVVTGSGGAGTVHLHSAVDGTATGTVAVLVTAGTLPAVYQFNGGTIPAGLRVVQSGTTGAMQTVVTFE